MNTARQLHYSYEDYQRLPSLRAVLFISHREPRITIVERGAAGWVQRTRAW